MNDFSQGHDGSGEGQVITWYCLETLFVNKWECVRNPTFLPSKKVANRFIHMKLDTSAKVKPNSCSLIGSSYINNRHVVDIL